MKSVRVVLAGEVLAGFLASAGVPLDAATEYQRTFVGAESNTAVGLARLGIDATFIGRVGDDALGRAAIRFLRGEGVDTSFLATVPGATGVLIRSASGTEGLEVIYARQGSAGSGLSPDDIPQQVVADAQAVHLTGITPMLSAAAEATSHRLMKLGERHGLVIAFDPNLRLKMAPISAWRATLAPLLSRAHVIFTGADELRALTQRDDTDQAVDAVWHERSRLVVVKNGAAGARAWDGSRWHVAPPDPASVADPVGAGDAFNAGFLARWLRGDAILDALNAGAFAGASVVQFRGDTAGLPTQMRTVVKGDVDR
ncbi:sugar kinase [Leifsonia sp. 22587]|uniref:sugar kinase n=1 Tax=Leifsonia sp. 22587 TaxID=3453946 RepID=UPI003F858BC0